MGLIVEGVWTLLPKCPEVNTGSVTDEPEPNYSTLCCWNPDTSASHHSFWGCLPVTAELGVVDKTSWLATPKVLLCISLYKTEGLIPEIEKRWVQLPKEQSRVMDNSQRMKNIYTQLPRASAKETIVIYAWRWLIHELQRTQGANRSER